MVKSLHRGNYLALFAIVFLGVVGLSQGFKQELWLYEEDGNGLYFHTAVADTSKYNLERITSFCARGMWYAFNQTNFYFFEKGMGSFVDDRLECGTIRNSSEIKSFRHWAAEETETDALSLYSEYEYAGIEIFVTGRAYAGIPHTIESVTGSGTTDWRLFEGQNLDGRSVCWNVPIPPWEFNFTYIRNLTTVGSVYKGCDLEEIRLYKEANGIISAQN